MTKLQFWVCLYFSAAGIAGGMAQPVVSTGALLASARRDLSVVLQGQQLDFMQEASRSLPWVEQVGVRTETNRFELNRQEYLGRINVNGVQEMNRQRELQASERVVAESRQRLVWHDVLGKRYAATVEYRGLRRQLDLQEQLLLVYDDKMRVLRKLAELSAEADVDELIKVEFDRDELALRQAEAQSRYRQLRQYIQEQVPAATGDWQLDTSAFIRPAQLEAVAASLPQTPASHPDLVEKEAKMARIEAEYQLERAKSRQMLDFFQLHYQNRPGELLQRDLAVGVGFNLPYKGSSRVKTGELIIEKHAAGNDALAFAAALSAKISGARQQLAALGSQYRLLQQQLADSQALFSLRQAQTGQSTDPLTLLRAKELVLKRQFRALEIEQDMFNEYLNILDWTGQISLSPPVDYLSTSLREF